jgi:hypothetical protein
MNDYINQTLPTVSIEGLTRRCRRCNRLLRDPKSVIAGIGPTCASQKSAGVKEITNDTANKPRIPRIRRIPEGQQALILDGIG